MSMMQRTYKFTARRMSSRAHADLDAAIALNRKLYNAANEERRLAFAQASGGISDSRSAVTLWPTWQSQDRHLTAIRAECPEYAAQDRRIQTKTLKRLDKAYAACWRERKKRRNKKRKPDAKHPKQISLPRFKNAHRFRTIEIYSGASNYLKPDGDKTGRYRIEIKGVPHIRIVDKHGRIPLGEQPKVIRITRKPKRVEVQMVFDIGEAPPTRPIVASADGDEPPGVGIDMGLAHQLITSGGRFAQKRTIDRRRLNRLERKMQRQRDAALREGRAEYVMQVNPETGKPIIGKDGKFKFKFHWIEFSNSYGKTRDARAKEWQRITERETGAAHRLTTSIVNEQKANGGLIIAVEDLQIPNMIKNRYLAKSIVEQGWGRIQSQLQYKAESAGIAFAKVHPAYTSQECARCGHRQKMPLAQRVFVCGADDCDYVEQRDVNAGNNVLRRALDARGGGETLPRRPVDKFRTPLGGEDAEIRSVLWAITKRGRVKRRRAGVSENAQMGFAFG